MSWNVDEEWNAGRAERAEQFRNEERVRFDTPPMLIRGWGAIFGAAGASLHTPVPRQLAAAVQRAVANPCPRPPVTVAGWLLRYSGCVLVFGIATYVVAKKANLLSDNHRDRPAHPVTT